MMKNVTELLRQTFPGVQIYPTLGNHDIQPANQVPGETDSYYQRILTLAGFNQLLGDTEMESFKKGIKQFILFLSYLSLESERGNV